MRPKQALDMSTSSASSPPTPAMQQWLFQWTSKANMRAYASYSMAALSFNPVVILTRIDKNGTRFDSSLLIHTKRSRSLWFQWLSRKYSVGCHSSRSYWRRWTPYSLDSDPVRHTRIQPSAVLFSKDDLYVCTFYKNSHFHTIVRVQISDDLIDWYGAWLRV